MRSPAHQLVALLVVPLLFAGCAEEAPASEPVETEALLVTDANDEESLTNESFQMQAHIHDYWGGKDRLVVMETTQPDQTFFVSDAFSSELKPEPGKFVPQGTSSVEMTVSWVDGERRQYGSPELWVRTAADDEPVLVGAIENGGTLTMPVTLASADLPHQTLSRWKFVWRIHPGDVPPGVINWNGEITMKVVAVRGLDIPVYPPHPDLWSGAEELPLLDEGQDFGTWQGTVDDPNCFGSCPLIHHPTNGSVVPYDTAIVEVAFTEGGDSITHVGLKYHAADAFEWIDLQPESVEGATRVFRIPVTTAMGDSPYASQSQWEFAPYVSDPQRDSLHAGSYHMTARVLRSP